MKKNRRENRPNQPAAKSKTAYGQDDRLPGSKPSIAKQAACACLAIIALNILIYWPVRHFEFVSVDDGLYVTANPAVNVGLTWRGLSWAMTAGYAANWHPLTWMSHMLDVQLFGLNPGLHHVTNILLHIANSLLLFGALFQMTRALGRSAFVAALFAVHPLRVESVAWVAERKDVLSTFFGLLAICAYARYARQPSWARYSVVAALFALSLMAKPMLVTLPAVLLLLDYWPLGRVSPGSWSRAALLAREKVPLLAMSVASGIVTVWAQGGGGAVAGLTGFPLDMRVANALVSAVAYIQKMLWPAGLAAFYPYPQTFPGVQAGVCLVLLAGMSTWVLASARRRPYAPIGWLWYMGTLLPVIGLVQVGEQAMADRYSYFPLIGVAIVVSWGMHEVLARWQSRNIVGAVGATLVIAALAVTARHQVQYWANSVALWEHTLEVTADNFRTHADLAGVLSEQGKLNEAVAHYSEALRIRPNVMATHNNLGITLARAGKLDDAAREFSEAIRLKPDFVEARNNLGTTLANQGKFREATAQFTEVLRLKPDNAQAHSNWGAALARQGNLEEALAHYSEALRLNPDFVEAHTRMGIVLTRQRRLDEAVAHFSKALEFTPDVAELHNNLGVALAEQGKAGDAAHQFSEALRIKPDFPDARANLARAQQSTTLSHQ
jgi:tetratricopeptide (TPR) repeat protein